MRTKEIMERTGLTDRAVRLYIDSGLLQPRSEGSYTGRRSLQFTEEDAAVLQTIAILRKADFSISDIREMQISPERIHDMVDAHRERLVGEIETKQRILESLSSVDRMDPISYTDLGDILHRSASKNHIPKEDSGMRLKDFQRMLKTRILAVVSFLLTLMGMVVLALPVIRAAFAAAEIKEGGGYHYNYIYLTADRFFDNIVLLAAGLVFAAAAVVLLLHLIIKKRGLAVAGGVLCILAAVLFLLLPANSLENLNFFEFWQWRLSPFFYRGYFFSYKHKVFLVLFQSWKYAILAAAAVLAFVSAFRQKNEHSEN